MVNLIIIGNENHFIREPLSSFGEKLINETPDLLRFRKMIDSMLTDDLNKFYFKYSKIQAFVDAIEEPTPTQVSYLAELSTEANSLLNRLDDSNGVEKMIVEAEEQIKSMILANGFNEAPLVGFDEFKGIYFIREVFNRGFLSDSKARESAIKYIKENSVSSPVDIDFSIKTLDNKIITSSSGALYSCLSKSTFYESLEILTEDYSSIAGFLSDILIEYKDKTRIETSNKESTQALMTHADKISSYMESFKEFLSEESSNKVIYNSDLYKEEAMKAQSSSETSAIDDFKSGIAEIVKTVSQLEPTEKQLNSFVSGVKDLTYDEIVNSQHLILNTYFYVFHEKEFIEKLSNWGAISLIEEITSL